MITVKFHIFRFSPDPLFLCICCIVLFSVSCGKADDIQPVTSVVTEGDTLFVANSGPLRPVPVFSLTHELTIGDPDGDPEKNFIQLRGVTVDDEGTIFLLDNDTGGLGGSTRVMVYDNKGKFIRSWGSPGEGPTDLGNTVSISAQPGGTVVIGGFSLTRVFTSRGRLLKTWRTLSTDSDSGWVPSGRPRIVRYLEEFDLSFVLAQRSGRSGGGLLSYSAALIRPGGKLVTVLDNLEIVGAFQSGGTARGDNYGALMSWLPELVGTVGNRGQIYWGTTDIMGYDSLDLRTGMYQRVTMDIPGQPLTSAEIDESVERRSRGPGGKADPSFYRWMRGLKYPATKPHYGAIHVDDTGRVWLMENLGGNTEHSRFMDEGILVTYYIFSPEGTYLGTAEAPLNIIQITETSLYSIERESEFRYRRIHRYRIREVHE